MLQLFVVFYNNCTCITINEILNLYFTGIKMYSQEPEQQKLRQLTEEAFAEDEIICI